MAENPLAQFIENARASGVEPGELVFGAAAYAKMRQDILPYAERPRPWMRVVYQGVCEGVPFRMSEVAKPHALMLMPRVLKRSIHEILDNWRVVK